MAEKPSSSALEHFFAELVHRMSKIRICMFQVLQFCQSKHEVIAYKRGIHTQILEACNGFQSKEKCTIPAAKNGMVMVKLKSLVNDSNA